MEQLSSDSDSLCEKGENKDNDKEKDLKNADVDIDVDSEELEIDVDVDVDVNVDVDLDVDLEDDQNLKDIKTEDIDELELNTDEKELNDVPNNTLGNYNCDGLDCSKGKKNLINNVSFIYCLKI